VVCGEQENHWLTRDQKVVHMEARGKKGKKMAEQTPLPCSIAVGHCTVLARWSANATPLASSSATAIEANSRTILRIPLHLL
jgi:hypothetical protein